MKNLLTLFLLTLIVNFAKAQNDKYTFAYWTNEFKTDSKDDACYLFVSDPIKNWYDINKSDRDNHEINFRTEANFKASYEVMKSFDSPIGFADKYTSSAKCKEAIQKKVFDFKNRYPKGYTTNTKKLPIKVVYVSLNLN